MVKNKHKALYITLSIVGALLLILAGAATWISYHYKGILKARIPILVAENTDSLYHATVGDISINILTRKVTLRNVHFYADTQKIAELKRKNICPRTTYNFTIPEVYAGGIDWTALTSGSKFDCKYLVINNPVTIFNGIPREDTSRMKKNGKAATLSAHEIFINNPDITYHYVSDSTDYSLRVKGGKIKFQDWLLDTRKGLDTANFLFSKNSVVNFDSFFYTKKDGMYNIGSAGIGFSSGNRDLTLKHMSIRLVGTHEQFYKKIGEQKEIYDFYLPTVKFAGLDWKELINGRMLHADTMNIFNPSLELYFSRKYPESKTSKVGKYPHQLLHSLGLKTDIRRLNIYNGHFKYTEQNKITGKEAAITFEHVNGNMKNVTNIDTLIKKDDKCLINLKGKYMSDATLTANFLLSLSDPHGAFTLDGNVNNIYARDINQTSRTLALTEVTTFHMSRLDMHIEGDETYGKGSITMLYDSLELAFLRINDDSSGLKKGPGLLSFLANKVALFPANPMPGKDVRHVTTYVKRDAYKGFFNLIWKNIFQGAKNTALRTPDLVNNIREKRNPEKKGFLRKVFGKNR